MSKSAEVIVRSEHVKVSVAKPETYGLSLDEYTSFCNKLESCRNPVGKWDYNKVRAFAKELLDYNDTPKDLDFRIFVKSEKEINEYLEEHDPLEINPWVKAPSPKNPT